MTKKSFEVTSESTKIIVSGKESLRLLSYSIPQSLKASYEIGSFIEVFSEEFLDSAAVLSEVYFSFTKNLLDSIEFNESLSVDLLRNIKSSYVANEAAALSLIKARTNTYTVNDSNLKKLEKPLNDSLSFATDSLSSVLETVKEESVQFSTSGTLISQSYTEDNTYFQQGYLGYYRLLS